MRLSGLLNQAEDEAPRMRFLSFGETPSWGSERMGGKYGIGSESVHGIELVEFLIRIRACQLWGCQGSGFVGCRTLGKRFGIVVDR